MSEIIIKIKKHYFILRLVGSSPFLKQKSSLSFNMKFQLNY